MDQVVAGKYRVIGLLGEGGMGSVYEAEATDSGNRVALKVVSQQHSDEISLQRFAREAQLASKVTSEHVVKVYDAGTDERSGLPFIAMEVLSGEELEDVLERVGALSVDVALCVAAQALSGLAHAHRAGVIHRDIKPQNFFMHVEPDRTRTVKLLDFGIAKQNREGVLDAETRGLTRTGTMMGSPLYMSPEQARGHKTVDERTDIWAMGIVLYRMLTGVIPHEDVEMLGELIVRITSGPPPPVQTLAPWVQPEVADIVERALEIDKEARFASAEEMLAAVVAVIGNDWTVTEDDLEPVQSATKRVVAPPSRARRLRDVSFADTRADETVPEDTYGAVTGELVVKKTRAPMVGVALGLVAVAGVAAFLVLGSRPPAQMARHWDLASAREVALLRAKQAEAASAPAPEPPAPSETVSLTVTSKPSDAKVYRGDDELGAAGAPIELARSSESVKLTLKRAGYRDKVVTVVPKADVVIQATLTPIPRAQPVTPLGHPDLESPL